MLVKKTREDWKPSENPELKIGETLDVTNPRDLIEQGLAVGLDSQGNELSAFELYGILTDDEKRDYEEFIAVRKQAKIQAKLQQEKAELEKQLADTKTEVPVEKTEQPKEEVKTETPVSVETVKKGKDGGKK